MNNLISEILDLDETISKLPMKLVMNKAYYSGAISTISVMIRSALCRSCKDPSEYTFEEKLAVITLAAKYKVVPI